MKPSSKGAQTRAAPPPPADRALHCRLVANGAAAPQAHFGDLPPVDLHDALGSAEPAATPSALLLATLGACLVDRIRANAAIGNIAVTGLVLEIEADLGVSPLWGAAGQAPGPAGFEAIQVKVHMDADAPDAALQAVVRHAMLWSPVANTLNAPIRLDVALVPRIVS